MDARFVALHNSFAAMGMAESGSISQGSLTEGGEARIEARLEPGQCYTVVGLGGAGVANLDVVVLDEGGTEVAHDTTTDGEAAAQFCPQYPGVYRIAVRMQRGSGDYIVSSWSGSPGGGSGVAPYTPDYGYPGTPPVAVRPPHGGPGTCDEPWVIGTGEPRRGDTTDGDAVFAGTCVAGGTAPEHVYQFTVEQRSLVTAVMNSTYDGALVLLGACGENRAELACNDDAPTTSRSEVQATLDPGLYYLVVDGYGSGMGQYEVTLAMTAMRSIGEVCGGALPLAPGAPVAGTTVGEANYFEATCAGQAQSPDRVYRMDVTQRSRLRVRMQSTYDGALHMRSTCADPSTEVACNDDFEDTRHSLLQATVDPGRYFIYADGFSTSASGDYSIAAELIPASGPPVAADSCASAGAIAPGTDLVADTFAAGDDATGSCGGGGSPDLVYRLDVRTRTRVRANFTSAEFAPVMYIQRTCGDATTEVVCLDARSGAPIDQTLTTGTYFLVIDGADQNAFGTASLHLQLDDLGALETSCRTAPLIHPGTQITGDTSTSTDRFQATCAGGANSPDMIYRLVIRRRSTVTVTSEQTGWDGAVYIRGDCTDMSTELGCSDDAGDNHHSMLTTELEPGSYFVFVDGFANGNSGPFTLDVDVQASR